jgi:hypothetical protein
MRENLQWILPCYIECIGISSVEEMELYETINHLSFFGRVNL